MSAITIYHLPAIRESIQSDFSHATSGGFISNDEMDRWANEGYMKYVMLLMMANQGYFEKSILLNITAASETISLPDNFAGEKRLLQTVRVERVLPNSTFPLNYKRRYDEPNQTVSAVSGTTYIPNYDFRGSSLVLEPTPSASETGGLKMIYKAMPPKLRSSNCQAAHASASYIYLDSGADVRDDYYNDAQIMITSGTGAGQIRTISDYTGSTQLAQLSADWTTKPDTTSVYSILIHKDFPESFHDILPCYATKCAFLKERSRGITISYDGQRLKELETQMIQFCEEKTTARKFTQPWHIESWY